jgi:hypothetical protein
MPNHCYQQVRITGPRDLVEVLNNAVKQGNLLQTVCPMPLEVYCEVNPLEQGWYDWRWNNWGTKWDICEVEDQQYIPSEKASLEFRCWTAWGAPIPIWDRLIKLGCTVDADYQDEGGLFEGQYRNGYNHSWKPNLEEELENA